MDNQLLEPRANDESDAAGTRLGKGLGWFSIGLGIAQLLAPKKMSRLVGAADDGKAPLFMRLCGMREIGVGLGLLSNPASSKLRWARVVGDALDLGLLGLAVRDSESRPRTLTMLGLTAGATAVDVYAAVRESRRKLGKPIRRAITIARSPHEVYQFWRQLEQLPLFMSWVQSVRDLGGGLSHWVIKTPAGMDIEYDAEITEDVPGRRIAWRSLPDATVPNRGSVTFVDAPGNRGTEVIVELEVSAPLGKTIAGAEARGDLRRLKQVLEVGEILLSDASIHKGPHPAQPAELGGV
jgi:uncharacterized membrane protein